MSIQNVLPNLRVLLEIVVAVVLVELSESINFGVRLLEPLIKALVVEMTAVEQTNLIGRQSRQLIVGRRTFLGSVGSKLSCFLLL